MYPYIYLFIAKANLQRERETEVKIFLPLIYSQVIAIAETEPMLILDPGVSV